MPQGLVSAAKIMSYQKTNCHSDRSRAPRGGVEEPCVWCRKAQGGSTAALRAFARYDNFSVGTSLRCRTLHMQTSIKPAFFLVLDGMAEAMPFQRTIFETSSMTFYPGYLYMRQWSRRPVRQWHRPQSPARGKYGSCPGRGGARRSVETFPVAGFEFQAA